MTTMTEQTALFETHKELKAKMVPFSGYDMPVWYSSIKEEHLKVREDMGIFDISHMGVLMISGDTAKAFIQNISCNDINKADDQKMIYSMVLNEQGGVLDDIMVGRLEDDQYVMVVNAGNKDKIQSWLKQHQDAEKIESLSSTHSFIAIQGPNAVAKVDDVFQTDITNQPRFGVRQVTIPSIGPESSIIMRTGYTGEDGVEICTPNNQAKSLWDKLIENGVSPIGLGARDTLRLEAGLPLYGQELSEEITPLMTRYKWVIGFNTEFIGKKALGQQKDSNQDFFTTVGLEMTERVIPRTDYPIKEGGKITSGTLSPSLEKPIAMAMVPPKYAEVGKELTVDIRGREYKAVVVKLPFVKK